MIDGYELLSLSAPVGKGQENHPDDVANLDNGLRQIGAYAPPPEYADGPQRYATEPVIDALERFQEKTGLKTDAIANPGGPTERAINNHLLNKPRGAGLLFAPVPPLADTVGNGFKNDARDVASAQRRLGALGYMPEDPFDAPPGIITEATTNGMKRFQLDKGLTPDGWMAPGGETERALEDSISDLALRMGRDWFDFVERARHEQQPMLKPQTLRVSPIGASEGLLDAPGENASSDEAGALVPVRADPEEYMRGWPDGREAGTVRGGSPGFVRRLTTVPGMQNAPRPRAYSPPTVPPVPNLRIPPPLARDFPWVDPTDPRQMPAPPGQSQTSPSDRRGFPTIHDINRALGFPPIPSVEEEVRRELKIPPKPPERLPYIYVPEPGSPLAIPIIDYNSDGRRGNPATQQSTKDLADAIEDACKKVFKDATFVRKYEKYFSKDKNTTRGSSYADAWMKIILPGGIAIHVISDTYTPKKTDMDPDAGEKRRYAKLQPNIEDRNVVVVRMPKPWALGQEINTKKLGEFTKELCEQIKNKVDKGEIGRGKDRLFWENFFKELIKAKPKNNQKVPPDKQE